MCDTLYENGEDCAVLLQKNIGEYMKRIVIYLGDEQTKKSPLELVLNTMELPYEFLNDEDLNETIGYLMKLNGYLSTNSTSTPLHFSNDLMILQDITDQEILEMNTKLKELNVSMERKAMITEHNKQWLLKDLLTEIEEEHTYFRTRDNILEVLQASSKLIISAYEETSWKAYEQAFYQAYETLQKQATLDELQSAYKTLSNAKINLVNK